MAWAKEHEDWTTSDWNNVLWSDESPFTLFQTSGRCYVRRRVGEEFLDECIAPTVKFGGGKINVWGCFSSHGVGPLIRIHGIMDGPKYRQILKTHMAPHLRKLGKKVIFQHDNDPKHTSKVAKNYLTNQHFSVLDWTSQSPDLNPIENLWGYVKFKIKKNVKKASSLDAVFDLVKETWENIPQNYINKLLLSMPNRCRAVIKNKGGATGY